MTRHSLLPACIALVLAGSAASAVAAQVRDTLPPPPDTMQVDTPQADTARVPPPAFVPMARFGATDAVRGIWRFDRDELLRAPVFTLADLLSRLPGISSWRTGLAMQPEAVSAYGGAGGRIEILRDGYPLDPLGGSVLDVSMVSLIEIAEIVVERRPDLLRIHLYTAQPTDARPYSRVEAGIGEPEIQTFHGLFLAPRFLIGPVSFAVDRLDTDGQGRDEPADAFVGWAKWGVQGENRGVQIELWQNTVNREPESPWPAKHIRQDIVLRARNRFFDGLVAELYAGRSNLEVRPFAVTEDDTLDERFERSTMQYGLRLMARRGPLWLDGALRYRSQEYLPQLETTVDAGTSLLDDRLQIAAGITRGSWRDIVATTAYRASGSIRPLPWVRAFAEIEGGRRGLPVFPDLRPLPPGEEGAPPPEPRPSGTMRSEVSSMRAGITLERGRFDLGAAVTDMSVDSVAAFGLPFDSTFRALPGGEGRAWEAFGRVDVARFWGGSLFVDGGWQNWFSGTGWPYRPSVRGSAGLGAHIVPLESGNLEVRGRVWIDHRGETAYPAFDDTGAQTLATLPSRSTIVADLMIRIIDVRIFARFEDWRGEDVTDIPDRTINGPRLFYGVRWHFWN